MSAEDMQFLAGRCGQSRLRRRARLKVGRENPDGETWKQTRFRRRSVQIDDVVEWSQYRREAASSPGNSGKPDRRTRWLRPGVRGRVWELQLPKLIARVRFPSSALR